MPLIGSLAFFLCLSLAAGVAPARGAGGEIGMQSFPLLKQARPLAEPVRTVLIILDSNGRALKKGTAHIRLIAPAPGRFFSTDFPLVEGSELLEMDLPILQGRAAWEYVFPIRGHYRLEVGPAVVGKPSQIDWRLSQPSDGGLAPAHLTLTITHLEKGRRVFSLDRIPTEGRFSLKFQFTDGAAYRITGVGWVEGRGAVERQREIRVTAVEPPREAIYPSLFLFLAFIALGLAAGRFSRRVTSKDR